MKNIFKALAPGLVACAIAGVAAWGANYNATAGSGLTFQATDNAGVLLPAFQLANSSGTEIGSSILSAVQGAIPAGTNLIGKVGIDQTTPGTTNGVSEVGSTIDPCRNNVATIKPFSITTATTTNIVTGTAAKKLYVCYLYMQSVAADNIAVISGTTGATCGANTAALVGGTTAANGLNNAANSGQAMGNGGYSVMQVLTNNDDICIITSAATPLAGLIKYVVQ